MAESLLDILQRSAGIQAPVTDQTSRLQTLLRAKSGKSVGTGDAAPSNLGEQSAVSSTQAELGQVGQQAAIQGQATKQAAQAQQQQTELQRAEIDQARQFQTVQTRLRTTQLLNDLQRDKASLDLDKDRSRLEQASFLLSMQDKGYTDELQDIGRKRRLDDDVAFRGELAQLAFQDNLSLLQDRLGKEDILQASNRDFQKALSSLSIQDALQVAEIEAKYNEGAAARQRGLVTYETGQKAKMAAGQAQAQGLGGLLRGGLEAYSTYSDMPKGKGVPSNGR